MNYIFKGLIRWALSFPFVLIIINRDAYFGSEDPSPLLFPCAVIVGVLLLGISIALCKWEDNSDSDNF